MYNIPGRMGESNLKLILNSACRMTQVGSTDHSLSEPDELIVTPSMSEMGLVGNILNCHPYIHDIYCDFVSCGL
jgi:hypothetical protein